MSLIVSAVAVGCTLSVTSIQLFVVDWDNYKSSLYLYLSEGGRYVNLLLVGGIGYFTQVHSVSH